MIVPTPMPASAMPIGQAHGQHRAEGHDEDEDGEGEAERLGAGRLEVGEDLAAELDLEAGAPSGMAAFTSLVRSAASSMVKSRGRPTRGVGDRAVLGDLLARPRGCTAR